MLLPCSTARGKKHFRTRNNKLTLEKQRSCARPFPYNLLVNQILFSLLDHSDENLSAFQFEERGLVQMKGKSEPMKTYLLRRRRGKEIAPHQHYDLLHSNHDGVMITNEYISLYRNLRQGAGSVSGRKSRNMSKFSTPGE